MKKTLLFAHYNPNSTGSFVDKTLSQVGFLKPDYNILCMIPSKGVFSEKLEAAGLKVHYREFHEKNNLLKYLLGFISFLAFLRKHKIDLVYFLDFVWWKPAEFLAAKLLRIPVLSFCGFYKAPAALKGYVSKADMIVLNSDATAKNFLLAGLQDRVRVVHNFVDPERYAAAESIRSEFCKNGEMLIAYVGVLRPIKGVEYFIESLCEVYKEFPNVKCLIVGSEKEQGYKAKLLTQVENSKLNGIVEFLDYRSDIPQIMKSIDVLVVPSLEEPFGYVNIEAGAAGVPVVATNVGGIPEIIVDGETGLLVEPKNSSQIAMALGSLLSDYEFRKKMGENGIKRVEDNFSKQKVLPQWKEVIANLLS